MVIRKHLLNLLLLIIPHAIAFADPALCPAGSATIPFHSAGGSLIAVSVYINHSGPYEFTVDTGSEITVVEPELASEARLQPQGSIRMAFVTNSAQANLVKAESVDAGSVAVPDLVMAVAGLNQIQMLDSSVRGILGENFLGRFDMLIDYSHKLICLDETKELQREMNGEKIPMIEQTEQDGDLAYTLPVLVAVHAPGDGKKGTILKLDSGSSAPILFENRYEPLSWRQRNRALRSQVAGTGAAPVFAAMTSQAVKIGPHLERQIAFLSPISPRQGMVRTGEDGLLPTVLFKRIFISCADHFVMFEPHEVQQSWWSSR
jgi:hypothetical protein